MNHIGDTNKMAETPRTDAVIARYTGDPGLIAELTSESRQLERGFNRACEMYRKLDIHALNLIDRIRRLESAGDRMEKLLPEGSICDKAVNAWREAKEAKP